MSRSDFNNDGFDDLAIGVRLETVGAVDDAGAVNVLFGSSSSLTARNDQYWTQDRSGIRDVAEAGDNFSRALVSGDFDGDGFSDLAIGVHFEDIAAVFNAGAVNVLYGSGSGLTSSGDQFWSQDSRGVIGVADEEDHFGESLAAGDFDNDGFDDLVIGAHFEDVGSATNAGAVNVLFGSSVGLTAMRNQYWTQDSSRVASSAETDDAFGEALAVGDFDNDGFDDLAVAAPGEAVGKIAAAGAVNVLRGSASGLTGTGSQLWSQDTRGVAGSAEANDRFGGSLAVGDFDGDGFDDLVVGAREEGVGSIADAGAVHVIHGSGAGLTATGDQIWTQDTRGVRGVAEKGDLFGDALAVGDFDGDGYDDLAIGARGESVGSARSAGAVSILYGSASGLTSVGDQLWTQDSRGVAGGDAESFDFFGDSLTVGDYNDDGFEDLVIGAPEEDIGSISNAGAVHLLLGSAAGLSAADDQVWFQNAAGVLGQSGTSDEFGFVLA